MSASTEDRTAAMRTELTNSADHHRTLARRWDRTTLMMTVSAITVGAVASFSGIAGASAHVVAGLALVPTLVASAMGLLKPDGKARWHHTRKNDLEVLRRRMLYEMPSPPSPDQLALISREFAKLDKKHHEEAPRYFGTDLSALGKSDSESRPSK
jgi:hypothetical protein